MSIGTVAAAIDTGDNHHYLLGEGVVDSSTARRIAQGVHVVEDIFHIGSEKRDGVNPLIKCCSVHSFTLKNDVLWGCRAYPWDRAIAKRAMV